MRQALASFFSSSTTRVVLGLALGFIFLFLALRGISWSQVQTTLSAADLRLVGLAFAVALLNNYLKIIRWNFLLCQSKPKIRLAEVSASFLSAQFINSLIPLRLGEISRIYTIGRLGADPGFVLGTILGEKYLDILVYAFALLFLLFGISAPVWMDENIPLLILGALFASLILFFLLLFRELFFQFIARVSERFSERVKTFILDHLRAGFAAFSIFKASWGLLALASTTALIWITALLINLILFLALDLDLPFRAGLLVLVAIMAGLSLPALPGKIGIFEYASILALAVYGLDRSSGISYGILLHIVVFLPILILGLFSLSYLQIRGFSSPAS